MADELRKKKKRRAPDSVAGARSVRHVAVTGEEPVAKVGGSIAGGGEKRWSPGQFILVLAAGFVLGGMGGWLLSRPVGPATATKDAASAQPTGQQPATGTDKMGAARKGQAEKMPQAQKPPQPGAYVPLAAWTPREGPEHAKVTIVEFSDFQ